MAKVIMVQGTMSNVGKSYVTAGLCRIFRQDGYRVAPFKSQNMALNSFITREGLEMGRAQAMQAEAAGIEPSVCMNPILLKPTNDVGSQVIVMGKVLGNMAAREYFAYKRELIPTIKEAFRELSSQADIIVVEGAGSPAEINLKKDDIVNMGLADILDAPVLLVGDIDRGGVFAQLLGTLMLLEDRELSRVKGLIVNKFRGDRTILDPGIEMLEKRGGVPVVGVLPYIKILLEGEDSLSRESGSVQSSRGGAGFDVGCVNIAVINLPRISNYTDFMVFETMEGVRLRYVERPEELSGADLIIIPGSKNTICDLRWMRENGIETTVIKMSRDTPVVGICGGYQMLGTSVSDPDNIEGGGEIRGLGLINKTTVIRSDKITTRIVGGFKEISGFYGFLSGLNVEGYEIHSGETDWKTDDICDAPGKQPEEAEIGAHSGEAGLMETRDLKGRRADEGYCRDLILGTYVHGIFDCGDIASRLVGKLADIKGIDLRGEARKDYKALRESQYDLLADSVRANMDMKAVYGMMQ